MSERSGLIRAIEKAGSIGITGHIRPDGDCVGSTVALYNYIRKNYPEKDVSLFLETIPESMRRVIDAPQEKNGQEYDLSFDLFVSLDSSSIDRLGPNQELFNKAGFRYVVDHHKTNTFFGDENHVVGDASSCCEVLYDLLEPERVDLKTAAPLYLGIVHDTGVFKYSSTGKHTMTVAGELLDKGVDSSAIIDGTFYEKTWNQNKLLGIALDKAVLYHDGYTALTLIEADDLKAAGCDASETDGIVEQLRLTRGVEIAVFVREDEEELYKFSVRAKNGDIDVSRIALKHGGGGHSKAAGFSLRGRADELISMVLSDIDELRRE